LFLELACQCCNACAARHDFVTGITPGQGRAGWGMSQRSCRDDLRAASTLDFHMSGERMVSSESRLFISTARHLCC
jgi:hypothetical protein